MIRQIIDHALALGPWNIRTLVVAFGVFCFALGTRFPRMLVMTAVGCYAVIMLNPEAVSLPGLVDLRLIGLGTAIYLAMLRQQLPRLAVLRRGVFPATIVYLFFGLTFTVVATDVGKAKEGLIGTLITMVFAWVLLTAADSDELRAAIRVSAGFMVIGSIVWVLVDPSVAIAGGRWRGITANANTLGIFAGLFFLTGKPRTGRWSIFPVIAVLIGSASRASTLALGVVAAPKMLEHQSRRVRQIAVVVMIIIAIPVVHAVFFSSADHNVGAGSANQTASITRNNNSRSDEWSNAIDIVQAHPVTGVGIGSQPDLVSSSIISPLVEIGVAALIPFAMIAAVAIRKVRQPYTWARALFFFLCINGIFEMWLFAGGSMFFMVFLLVGYDHAAPTVDPDPEVDDDEPELDSVAALDGPRAWRAPARRGIPTG